MDYLEFLCGGCQHLGRSVLSFFFFFLSLFVCIISFDRYCFLVERLVYLPVNVSIVLFLCSKGTFESEGVEIFVLGYGVSLTLAIRASSLYWYCTGNISIILTLSGGFKLNQIKGMK